VARFSAQPAAVRHQQTTLGRRPAADGEVGQGRFYTHRLPNGLQLLGQYMPEVQSVSACFYVNTGARDEDPQIMGVSHFLEHMMFKGTPRRSYQDINREFEEMGAENNAGTWLEFTYYWAKVLNDQLPRLIDLLADMMRPKLDPTDFEQERGVILEEIARYEDIPTSLLFDHLMESYYAGHPLSHRTLGTTETISTMTVEQMKAYWARRYEANNILFSVAGNFDWQAVCDQIAHLCGGWGTGEAGRTATDATPAPTFKAFTKDDMQQEMLAFGLRSVSQSDPARYTADVLGTILGDSTGSRLFWGVREAGLAESVGAEYLALDGSGLIIVYATTEPGKAVQTLEAVRREVQRLQDGGVTEEELRRAKTKLATRVVLEGESTNRRMLSLIGSWLSIGRLETLEEVEEAIERVSVQDCRDLLDRLPLPEHEVGVALGPVRGLVISD
jgi:predicted Zn-dependent peptidase